MPVNQGFAVIVEKSKRPNKFNLTKDYDENKD